MGDPHLISTWKRKQQKKPKAVMKCRPHEFIYLGAWVLLTVRSSYRSRIWATKSGPRPNIVYVSFCFKIDLTMRPAR